MIKSQVKRFLAYRPLPQTAALRTLLREARARDPDYPYCPDWEGDLIWSLIAANKLRHCLETGFGTGSSALYMLHAVGDAGSVTSIDMSPNNFNQLGKANLAKSGFANHTLLEEPSEHALPKMLLEERRFDFVFIDDWKTFDHLAFEIYAVNRMLSDGGILMFDDTRMDSVNKAVGLLTSHYRYREVDYRAHNQEWRLRMFHVLTTRSLRRPYRAFAKTLALADQPAAKDYRFFRAF